MQLECIKLPYFAPINPLQATFRESADIIVPDTYPDIGRVICTAGGVSVKDVVSQTDRVLISGTATAQILYQPDSKNGVRKLTLPINFAHIAEQAGVSPDCLCHVQCEIAGWEAKVVNSRKVSITAQIVTELTIYIPKILEYTQDVLEASPSVQCQHQMVQLSLIDAVMPAEFTILEDVEVTGGNYLEIISAEATVTCTEQQEIGSRLMLKGDVQLSLLGLDDDDRLQTMQHAFRFAQVVEAADANDSAIAKPLELRLAVHHIDCMMQGEGVLAVGIGVHVTMLSCNQQSVQILQDLYDTDALCSVENAKIAVQTVQGSHPITHELSVVIPANRVIQQVTKLEAICTGARQIEGDDWQISLQAKAICTDENDHAWSVSRAYTCPISLQNLPPNAVLRQVKITPNGHQVADQNGEQTITVNLQLQAMAHDCPTVQLEQIHAIQPLGERPPLEGNITLLLAYVQQEQPLWNIAKRHASTIKQIQIANGLETQTDAVSDCMLLIPICAG